MAEIVLEVALIAIARKVIMLDQSKYDGLTELAIAALIIALSVGFFLLRRTRCARAAIPPTRSSMSDQERPPP